MFSQTSLSVVQSQKCRLMEGVTRVCKTTTRVSCARPGVAGRQAGLMLCTCIMIECSMTDVAGG